MADTLIIQRKISSKKKNKRPNKVVTFETGVKASTLSQVRRNIDKIVSKEIKKNGYKRQDDPLIKDIRKIAHKFQAKL
jgi:hypothetical protein